MSIPEDYRAPALPIDKPRRTAVFRGRELASASAVSFLVGAATSALGLLCGVVAARRLGTDGRGKIAIVQIVVAASVVLGGLGLSDAIIYFAKSQSLNVRSLYLRFERLVCLGGAALTGAAMLVTAALWAVLGLHSMRTAVLYCLIVLPYAQMMLIGGALRASGRSAAWNVTRLVTTLTWLASLALPRSTTFSAVLQAHAALMTLAWLALRRLIVSSKVSQGAPTTSLVSKAALRYGAPSALIGLPVLLNGKVDQIVVAGMRSIDSAGVYAAAAGLAAGAFLFPQSVALILFPAVASGRIGTQAHTKRIVRVGMPLCLAVGVLYGVAGYVAWPHLFGGRFAAGRLPVITLSVAWALAGFNSILEETFRGFGRSRTPLVTQWVSAVSSLVLAAGLTRFFGLGGAAAGSLGGFAAGTLALLFTIRRHSHSTDVEPNEGVGA
jgi:O-antigen/teichoic acid export membrane protein